MNYLSVANYLFTYKKNTYIYVCVCVCVRARAKTTHGPSSATAMVVESKPSSGVVLKREAL